MGVNGWNQGLHTGSYMVGPAFSHVVAAAEVTFTARVAGRVSVG